jgi:phenylalanyl-tRNA synthetase beta chain
MIDRLIMIGHEVEEVIDLGVMDNPICVARVEKVAPHPSRLKAGASDQTKNLTVCEVNAGDGKPLNVVCGAPNVREGMMTVLARIGAKLPAGGVLERAIIRGVESEGMLMAEDEMGLGSNHEGIIELEPDVKIGEGYDMILGLEITPNRPDCLSVLGLARDLAASYNRKVYFHADRIKETFENIHDLVSLSIRCPEECPQYMGRVIRGVKIAPSPNWLRRRLLAVGLRPINNVVDVTNLVLMEIGHPLHAFDLSKLRKSEIIVRLAKKDEKIRLIDDSEITLDGDEDMVIADGVGPVAFAGIMGGANTEVTDKTEDILLESAYFKPTRIRRSSKRHKISSDASYRFERGADFGVLGEALDRAAGLIAKLADGKIPKGVLNNHPKRLEKNILMFRAERAQRVIGVDIGKTEIADLIAVIGCEIVRMDRDMLVLNVPSFRVDITREEDIFEEIARLHGFNKIRATLPYLPASAGVLHPEVRARRLVQDTLVKMGFHEALHISLIGEAALRDLGMDADKALRLLNPLSRDQELLRPDLLPSMMKTLVHNQNRGQSDLRLFEASKVFVSPDGSIEKREEPLRLMLAGMGAVRPGDWREKGAASFDFFHMKGALEKFLDQLGIRGMRLEKGGPDWLHPGRRVRVFVAGPQRELEVGWMGELNPVLRDKFDLRHRPVLSELALDLLVPLIDLGRAFKEIPRYPGIERDLALALDADIPAGRVEEIIRNTAGDPLESLFLFDCYTGDQVGAGRKSLGYRAVYRRPDRTLKDEEVDEIQRLILDNLSRETGASLRV